MPSQCHIHFPSIHPEVIVITFCCRNGTRQLCNTIRNTKNQMGHKLQKNVEAWVALHCINVQRKTCEASASLTVDDREFLSS